MRIIDDCVGVEGVAVVIQTEVLRQNANRRHGSAKMKPTVNSIASYTESPGGVVVTSRSQHAVLETHQTNAMSVSTSSHYSCSADSSSSTMSSHELKDISSMPTPAVLLLPHVFSPLRTDTHRRRTDGKHQ